MSAHSGVVQTQKLAADERNGLQNQDNVTNASDPDIKNDQMTGGEDKKGVMMLARPVLDSDTTLNLYDDPIAQTGNQKLQTPVMVRVDADDTKVSNKGKKYVKITEVPSKPEIRPGYGFAQSIRNTDSIFRAMDIGGFGSDETERKVYLANINHESNKGTRYCESTDYSYEDFTGFRAGLNLDAYRNAQIRARNAYPRGNAPNGSQQGSNGPGRQGPNDPGQFEQGKGANAQAKAYCAACVMAGMDLERDFKRWNNERKANIMYGVEAQTLPNGDNVDLGDTPKYEELGNTNNDDGNRYRGRGAIQLTGRTNYETMNTKLNQADDSGKSPYEQMSGEKGTVDIVSTPELVSDNEDLANLVSALYWRDNVHADVEGKNATDAIQQSRKKINKGNNVNEVTAQYNALNGYDDAYTSYTDEKTEKSEDGE